jgi:hypothetical protein
VSATTPGETVPPLGTTAMCSPQGQDHLTWLPLPGFSVQLCLRSLRSTVLYLIELAMLRTLPALLLGVKSDLTPAVNRVRRYPRHRRRLHQSGCDMLTLDGRSSDCAALADMALSWLSDAETSLLNCRPDIETAAADGIMRDIDCMMAGLQVALGHPKRLLNLEQLVVGARRHLHRPRIRRPPTLRSPSPASA